MVDETKGESRPVIHIYGAMDIEISGNIYPNDDWSPDRFVLAERNKQVWGDDVSLDGISVIPDKNY